MRIARYPSPKSKLYSEMHSSECACYKKLSVANYRMCNRTVCSAADRSFTSRGESPFSAKVSMGLCSRSDGSTPSFPHARRDRGELMTCAGELQGSGVACRTQYASRKHHS